MLVVMTQATVAPNVRLVAPIVGLPMASAIQLATILLVPGMTKIVVMSALQIVVMTWSAMVVAIWHVLMKPASGMVETVIVPRAAMTECMTTVPVKLNVTLTPAKFSISTAVVHQVVPVVGWEMRSAIQDATTLVVDMTRGIVVLNVLLVVPMNGLAMVFAIQNATMLIVLLTMGTVINRS
jgi:hypothetical protein